VIDKYVVGTGTYAEALAWLEYCNGTGDTRSEYLKPYPYTVLTEAAGRIFAGRIPEGMNRTMSSIGVSAMRVSLGALTCNFRLMSAVYGPWQVGNLSATDYAKKAKMWAHGLKLVDPTIKLISCGNTVRTCFPLPPGLF